MTEERFDIYDEEDRWIGTASRHDTHRLGYWHHSFHCWIARQEDARSYLLFQQRQSTKDTYPDLYDITAAGHLTAGEDMSMAARELQEELGVKAELHELIPLGHTREELQGYLNGVPFVDREVSSVFGLLDQRPLHAYQLQQEEVAGLYEAELEDMLALFEGRLPTVHARGVNVEAKFAGSSSSLEDRQITADQFVPRQMDYYQRVCRALLHFIAGSNEVDTRLH
ncbi:NUDIX hydrolase [Paenibacillus massiliensis]|uniref:NUDIX hydrolase n=1 Tax=Paenibacillus massiliensis TaxID=225917 RepID=UPI000360177A|nr:NUDIX domain-containing protein [Paenibacillus massiliensis]